MTTLLLIRHAQNEWVRTGRLAGWTPEVHLNDKGHEQANLLGQRLASAKLSAIYSSPLIRCVETARAVAEHHPSLEVIEEAGIGEVQFGDWQGKKLSQLRRKRIWEVVQRYPSGMQFPGGETFPQMQRRAVDACEMLAKRHPGGRVAIFSHSDVIKAIVANYLGVHLDLFQRINVSTASISVVRLGRTGPFVQTVSDTGHLAPPFKPENKEED